MNYVVPKLTADYFLSCLCWSVFRSINVNRFRKFSFDISLRINWPLKHGRMPLLYFFVYLYKVTGLAIKLMKGWLNYCELHCR